MEPLLHNHMWVKEGFMGYRSTCSKSSCCREAFVEMAKDNQQFVLEQAHIDDEGSGHCRLFDAQIYGRHSYNKGAWANLRNYLTTCSAVGDRRAPANYGGALDDVTLERRGKRPLVDLTVVRCPHSPAGIRRGCRQRHHRPAREVLA